MPFKGIFSLLNKFIFNVMIIIVICRIVIIFNILLVEVVIDEEK